jgi:hypothetical protein
MLIFIFWNLLLLSTIITIFVVMIGMEEDIKSLLYLGIYSLIINLILDVMFLCMFSNQILNLVFY